MKKIILTVAAVFALSFANAQDKKEGSAGFAKGDLYLTGEASLMNEKQGDVKTDGLTLSPGLGYFLTDNVALVGALEVGSSKDAAGDKTSTFGLHAGVKYFWTPASQFSLSIGGELAYDTAKVGDVKTNTIGLMVPVGLHYFVSNNFAITSTWGGLNYSSEKVDVTGAEAKNTLGLKLDMSAINFGLLYKL